MEDTIKLWFKEGYTDFDSNEGLNRDNPFELKRLNIVVGANNSGKSRFMRELIFKLKVDNVDFQYPQAYKDYISIINSFIGIYSSKHQLETPNDFLYSLEDIIREWRNIGSSLIDTRKNIEAHITYRNNKTKYETLEYEIISRISQHKLKDVTDEINKL